MEHEWKYKAAMAEYKLTHDELPNDAKIGIASITEIMRVLGTLEKKGSKPQQRTIDKVKALDKWVYYEILDYVQDTDENAKEAPVTKEEIKAELAATTAATAAAAKAEETATPAPDDEGLVIEKELEEMHKSGRTDWDIESVKPIAKKTYAVLFDNYKENEDNGVQTSKFSLIETSPKTFTLTQV